MRPAFSRVFRIAAGLVLVALAGSACSSDVSPPPPATAIAPAVVAAAAAAAAKMSDADLVGQVLMPSVNLSDPAGGSAELVRRYRLGGVILMGDVRDTAASATARDVRALTDALRTANAERSGAPDLLIGTDQEYGWVTRIKSGVVQLPSAMALGAAGQPGLTEAAWRSAGAELSALGITVDFAPDADVVDSSTNTVIGSRSYGSDPAQVGAQVAAAVRGLQSVGIAATVKHFPGHGHTAVNSHDALPVLRQSEASLAAGDLPPFQAGIDAGAWLVMAGHLDTQAIDPGTPATFSHKVLVDLLRTRMKFTGVVVTDALNMKPAMRWPAGEAAVRAMLAGADVLLMPPDLGAAAAGLLGALATGRLPRARLVEAVTRILTLKSWLAGFPQPPVSSLLSPASVAAAQAATAAAITVLAGPCTGPVVSGPVRVTASAGREGPREWLVGALREQGVEVVDQGGSLVHLVGYGDGPADLAPGARVTVAMDTPFVLGAATSPVRIATYSATPEAMRALAAVLAGKARAGGRSPVPVEGLPRTACPDSG
jgi:beta-N-acetylhexosaminidase